MIIEDIFKENPIIAAINSDKLLFEVVKSDVKVVFVLYGTILTLPSIVEKLKNSGKIAIVHTDLINGLSSKEVAVDYIASSTKAYGIISTKTNLVKRAKELGLIAGVRSFVVDSMALSGAVSHLTSTKPDFLEIMPGLVYSVISELAKYNIPIVAGGLIKTRDEILSALNAGASAISSTSPKRFNGIKSNIFVGSRLSVIFVLINPGATALTLIFLEPSSFAKDLVKPIKPAFEAE